MRERDKGTATENFGCWRFIVYEKNQKALRGGVFINPPPPPTHTHTHTHTQKWLDHLLLMTSYLATTVTDHH